MKSVVCMNANAVVHMTIYVNLVTSWLVSYIKHYCSYKMKVAIPEKMVIVTVGLSSVADEQ